MKKSCMTTLAILSALVLAVGCSDGQDLTALGDLSLLGECELPDGYSVVGLDEVLTTTDANACALGGQNVMFRGTVQVGEVSTTLIACNEDNPCCNCTHADFQFEDLSDDDARITIVNDIYDLDVFCEGTECDLFCYGLHEARDYVVWGSMFCDSENNPEGANTHERKLLLGGFCKLSTDPTPTERFTNPNGNCDWI